MPTQIDSLLDRFAHFGVDLSLDRITTLLAALGNPHQQVPIIHVAGSNGKGSVCAMLSSVLKQAGYRVGRYTSPHLVEWRERMTLNGEAIAPEELESTLQTVIAAIAPDRPSPTQFEVITAAAWLYFARQAVDIAVVEVGLGGRLDATNVCDRPLVSVITSLSREHWQRLGPTLADISREKAGILKPGCPAVLAPLPEAARSVVMGRLLALGCPFVEVQPSGDLSRELGDGWAEYPGGTVQLPQPQFGSSALMSLSAFRYHLPLPGVHQRVNAAVAIATLQMLQHQGWQISPTAIQEGLAQTQWAGRLQWMTWQHQPLLIDGAHNPAAAEALRHYVDQSDRVTKPVSWVMGMLSTKDHADVFRALLRPGDRLFLVPVPDHLTADPAELKQLAQSLCPELAECETFQQVGEALKAAIAASKDTAQPGTTILCGSLYLIGHFLKTEQGETASGLT